MIILTLLGHESHIKVNSSSFLKVDTKVFASERSLCLSYSAEN